jgi:hypothetical protein
MYSPTKDLEAQFRCTFGVPNIVIFPKPVARLQFDQSMKIDFADTVCGSGIDRLALGYQDLWFDFWSNRMWGGEISDAWSVCFVDNDVPNNFLTALRNCVPEVIDISRAPEALWQ